MPKFFATNRVRGVAGEFISETLARQGFKDKIAEIEKTLKDNKRSFIRVICEAAKQEQCDLFTSVLTKLWKTFNRYGI